MALWTRRKFWDGTEAIFVTSGCFDLDSDELGGIIEKQITECTTEMDEWLELKKIRMEFMNGKKSD